MLPDPTVEVHTFNDFDDAFRFVADLLPATVPEPVRLALAHNFVLLFDDGLADIWPREAPPASAEPPGVDVGAPFDYCKDTYAIRPADVRELAGHLASLVGAGFSLGGLSPAASTAIFALSAFWALRRLTRMGADLSPIQRQVLLTLRKRGPLTLDLLTDAALGFGKEWSRDDIAQALAELQEKALRDQRVVPLVAQNSDGLWFTEARGLWELPVGVSDLYDL
jgi:hypothetical protein